MEGECSNDWATAANVHSARSAKYKKVHLRLFQCTVLPYDFAFSFLRLG